MEHELRRALVQPILTLCALMALLLLDALLGYFFIANRTWIIEAFVSIAMGIVILMFSMEGLKDPALMRLFTFVGFFWLCILFALTMVDYATR